MYTKLTTTNYCVVNVSAYLLSASPKLLQGKLSYWVPLQTYKSKLYKIRKLGSSLKNN